MIGTIGAIGITHLVHCAAVVNAQVIAARKNTRYTICTFISTTNNRISSVILLHLALNPSDLGMVRMSFIECTATTEGGVRAVLIGDISGDGAHLRQIGANSTFTRILPGSAEDGNRHHARQHADDADHDKHLDQCESIAPPLFTPPHEKRVLLA